MNQLYGTARQLLATAGLDLSAVTLAVALVRSAYSPNLAADAFVTDLGANVAARLDLAGVTVTLGKVSASPTDLGNVSGAACDALVAFVNTGNDATSNLVAYIDTAPGLPFLPTGGDVTVTWDAVDGVFTL